jgi:MFS family permease
MRRTVAAGVSPATAVLGLFVTFGVVVASFFPFLSIYFDGRGFDPGEIGAILAAMAVVRMVAMPIWGHVADTRTGRRRALQLGLVGMVSFAIVASVLDSFVGVAFGAVGIALAMAASGPNIDALALVELGEERMADYGRVRAWESLSYATACLVIGLLLDLYGVTLALPAYGAAAAVTLVWTTIAVRPDRPEHREDHGRLGSIGAVFRKVYALGCFVYAIGFFLWGVIDDRTIVSLLAVFEGAGFSLLFTTSILVVGKLLPSSLYSSGNSLGAMVGFGIGPILGAGIGGLVYDDLGPVTLFVGSAVLAAAGGIAALVALRTPALDSPFEETPPAREEVPPEPGRL